jgi:hypothetical protein
MHGQHVRPGWQPGAIAVSLCDVRDRPAIDLQIESKIPSEVRHSVHRQAARRKVMIRSEVIRRGTSLRNGADEKCAYKSKNRKNDAGEAVSWFHRIHYMYKLDFRQQIAAESVTNPPEYSKEVALRYVSAYESRKDNIDVAS